MNRITSKNNINFSYDNCRLLRSILAEDSSFTSLCTLNIHDTIDPIPTIIMEDVPCIILESAFKGSASKGESEKIQAEPVVIAISSSHKKFHKAVELIDRFSACKGFHKISIKQKMNVEPGALEDANKEIIFSESIQIIGVMQTSKFLFLAIQSRKSELKTKMIDAKGRVTANDSTSFDNDASVIDSIGNSEINDKFWTSIMDDSVRTFKSLSKNSGEDHSGFKLSVRGEDGIDHPFQSSITDFEWFADTSYAFSGNSEKIRVRYAYIILGKNEKNIVHLRRMFAESRTGDFILENTKKTGNNYEPKEKTKLRCSQILGFRSFNFSSTFIFVLSVKKIELEASEIDELQNRKGKSPASITDYRFEGQISDGLEKTESVENIE